MATNSRASFCSRTTRLSPSRSAGRRLRRELKRPSEGYFLQTRIHIFSKARRNLSSTILSSRHTGRRNQSMLRSEQPRDSSPCFRFLSPIDLKEREDAFSNYSMKKLSSTFPTLDVNSRWHLDRKSWTRTTTFLPVRRATELFDNLEMFRQMPRRRRPTISRPNARSTPRTPTNSSNSNHLYITVSA